MANLVPLRVWGAQRSLCPRADRCSVEHREPRPLAGCAQPTVQLRQSSRHAARRGRQSGACRAVARAPSTVGTLVDLAVEELPLRFGAGVRIVGDCDELGNWNANDAPDLGWSEGDNWHRQLKLPAGLHSFKLVIIEDKEQHWEDGEDRQAEVPEEEMDIETRLELSCRFNQTQSTQAKAKPSPRKSDGAVAQAAATEAPPKPKQASSDSGGADPSFKDVKKESGEDGSITFSFPKNYRFRGGIEDSPPESDAETPAASNEDEYEAGEIVDIQEDPSSKAASDELKKNYKPVYSESQLDEMDKAYGSAVGSDSSSFNMADLSKGAESGGWTMSDEYDAPDGEYGDDKPDADKDDEGGQEDWSQEGAGSPIDFNDPGDFYEGEPDAEA